MGITKKLSRYLGQDWELPKRSPSIRDGNRKPKKLFPLFGNGNSRRSRWEIYGNGNFSLMPGEDDQNPNTLNNISRYKIGLVVSSRKTCWDKIRLSGLEKNPCSFYKNKIVSPSSVVILGIKFFFYIQKKILPVPVLKLDRVGPVDNRPSTD